MITVCAPPELLEDLGEKEYKICSKEEAPNVDSGVLLYLYEDGYHQNFNPTVTVIINEVSRTLESLHHPSILRINGWKGFLARDTWEIAGIVNEDVLKTIEWFGKKIIVCKDKPGFISARILAMIINEAFFALNEGVSTEKEIDIAMRLGTGYPYGPFEWANLIGISHVYTLLSELNNTDPLYNACSLLANQATL